MGSNDGPGAFPPCPACGDTFDDCRCKVPDDAEEAIL